MNPKMSKLSFRARQLDATKPMPVYKSDEIPEMPDFAAINRAVPQMPTGMEKEEETEHHLQRALSAQQVYGTAERLVIPVPEVSDAQQRYQKFYVPKLDFKPPKQYIHVQAFSMDQEIPDYDMDSEDETWLGKQAKKIEVLPLQFEQMMDRLEKGSGQQVVSLNDAKALLKEDDELTIAVYDYWLNKRLRMQHALIPQVKTEKRDGSTTNNPYVAFRRRTEKMQTRKNRKNDEVSYEKQLKLRRDINRALTILEMAKRREKSKKELLQLTIEIFEKRYQAQDFDNKMYQEALAQKHQRPSFIHLQASQYNHVAKLWVSAPTPATTHRKKREYRRKPKASTSAASQNHLPGVNVATNAGRQPTLSRNLTPASSTTTPLAHLPHYTQMDSYHQTNTDLYSSEEEVATPPLSPEPESEEDPDGVYAFKRKAGCSYHAPKQDGLGDEPWHGNNENLSFRLTSMPRQCIGFARRRMGRGGRVMFDRTHSELDKELSSIDFSADAPMPSPPDSPSYSPTPPKVARLDDILTQIRKQRIPHYRPISPPTSSECGLSSTGGGAGCRNPLCSQHYNHHTSTSHSIGLGFVKCQSHASFLSQQLHTASSSTTTVAAFHHSSSAASLIRHSSFSQLDSKDDLYVENYHSHREALLNMQRQQEEKLLRQQTNLLDRSTSDQVPSSFDLDHSFGNSGSGMVSDDPASHPTVDKATANFAVSAVKSTPEDKFSVDGSKKLVVTPISSHSVTSLPGGISGMSTVVASGSVSIATAPTAVVVSTPNHLLKNGPVAVAAKAEGFSTEPAATVYELNFPTSNAGGTAMPNAITAQQATARTKTFTKSTNFKTLVNKPEGAVLANALSPMLKITPGSGAASVSGGSGVVQAAPVVGASGAIIKQGQKTAVAVGDGGAVIISNKNCDNVVNNNGNAVEGTVATASVR